jgi:hypothetical protein
MCVLARQSSDAKRAQTDITNLARPCGNATTKRGTNRANAMLALAVTGRALPKSRPQPLAQKAERQLEQEQQQEPEARPLLARAQASRCHVVLAPAARCACRRSPRSRRPANRFPRPTLLPADQRNIHTSTPQRWLLLRALLPTASVALLPQPPSFMHRRRSTINSYGLARPVLTGRQVIK